MKRLIRNSGLEQSDVTIAGIDYTFGRKLIGEEGWYERLGGDNNPLSDAIMDRIVYDAYKINIVSIDPSKDLSMREVYVLNKNQA